MKLVEFENHRGGPVFVNPAFVVAVGGFTAESVDDEPMPDRAVIETDPGSEMAPVVVKGSPSVVADRLRDA
jgi:hypothetical protein